MLIDLIQSHGSVIFAFTRQGYAHTRGNNLKDVMFQCKGVFSCFDRQGVFRRLSNGFPT